MRKILYIFCFFFILKCYSQQFYINGIVKNGDKKEIIPGAIITIKKENDRKATGVFSNRDGSFKIQNLVLGKYYLRISFVGFKHFQQNIEIKNQNIDLGTIFLQPDSIILNEVTAEGEAILMQQVDDTTQYDAKAVKIQDDAMVEDLIKKLPGIKKNKKGEIEAQGEKVKKVYVDKKPFFGDDIDAALKNLPANIIDKVQVYDEESEQSRFTGFSDGRAVKVINLETKSSSRLKEIRFGKISGSFGNEEKYQAGGNVNLFDTLYRISVIGTSNNMNISKFSTSSDRFSSMKNTQRNQDRYIHGAGVTYSNTKEHENELSGSYYFTNSDGDNESALNRQYLLSEFDKNYTETTNTEMNYYTHKFELKFLNDLSKWSSFSIIPRFIYSSSKTTSRLNAETSADQIPVTSLMKSNTAGNELYNISGTVGYNQILSNSGRSISVKLDGSIDDNDEADKWTNINRLNETATGNTIRNAINTVDVLKRISSNLLFTEVINKNNRLQFSYNVMYSWNEYDKRNYELVLESSLFDSLTSIVYINKNWSHKSGVSFNYKENNINVIAGIFYNLNSYGKTQDIPNIVKDNREYYSITSSVVINYTIEKWQSIKLSYYSQPIIPSIDKLQNVLDNENPLLLSIGNTMMCPPKSRHEVKIII